jgi:hypothetical protein
MKIASVISTEVPSRKRISFAPPCNQREAGSVADHPTVTLPGRLHLLVGHAQA